MYQNEALVWDYEENKLGWKIYFGKLHGSENLFHIMLLLF